MQAPLVGEEGSRNLYVKIPARSPEIAFPALQMTFHFHRTWPLPKKKSTAGSDLYMNAGCEVSTTSLIQILTCKLLMCSLSSC